MRIKNVVGNIGLITSVLSGGFIFSETVASNFGIYSFVLLPVFIVSSIIAIVLPSNLHINFIHRHLTGLIVWISAIGLTFAAILAYNKLRNHSPVLYSVEFYWEEGIDIAFMENGTFRAQNDNMLQGKVLYGKYSTYDSLIILENEVFWGMSKMKDTLTITSEGIDFDLEKPWRGVSQATMTYKKGSF